QRDAAIDHVATGITALLARNLRVVIPDLLAGLRVKRDNLAPGERDIHNPVCDDRTRLEAAHRIGPVFPRDSETTDIAGVDLVERREALLGIGTPVAQPLAGI